MEENEAKRREILRKKKHKRSRGLSFDEADEVIDKFSKVAVVKQRVSTKEQVSKNKLIKIGKLASLLSQCFLNNFLEYVIAVQ